MDLTELDFIYLENVEQLALNNWRFKVFPGQPSNQGKTNCKLAELNATICSFANVMLWSKVIDQEQRLVMLAALPANVHQIP